MAIFAVLSVVMFFVFCVDEGASEPSRDQKTNVKEELGELVRNWPWITLLVASVFSTSFITVRFRGASFSISSMW